MLNRITNLSISPLRADEYDIPIPSINQIHVKEPCNLFQRVKCEDDKTIIEAKSCASEAA